MRGFLVLLFLFFGWYLVDVGFCGRGGGGEVGHRDVEEVMKRSESWKRVLEGMISNGSVGGRSFRQKAEELKSYSESREFRERVERYRDVVGQILGERYGFSYWDLKEGQGRGVERGKRVLRGEGYVLGGDERIYVFVSSSMGDLVRKYVEDSVIVIGEVKFVLRGAIGGLTYLNPTAKWVLDMLLIDRNCKLIEGQCELYDRDFLIDPLLFRRFKIQKVPAVVYVKGNVEKPDLVVISSGGVAFERHLERIFSVIRSKSS